MARYKLVFHDKSAQAIIHTVQMTIFIKQGLC